MNETSHISEEELDRYILSMISDEKELAPLEEHLLWCPSCLDRAERVQQHVNAMRVAMVEHALDRLKD